MAGYGDEHSSFTVLPSPEKWTCPSIFNAACDDIYIFFIASEVPITFIVKVQLREASRERMALLRTLAREGRAGIWRLCPMKGRSVGLAHLRHHVHQPRNAGKQGRPRDFEIVEVLRASQRTSPGCRSRKQSHWLSQSARSKENHEL